MNFVGLIRALLLAAILCAAGLPASLQACSACFGQSDSPLAEGMNMGILTLLVVVVFVLGGIAGFFIYLARRAASAAPATPPAIPATNK